MAVELRRASGLAPAGLASQDSPSRDEREGADPPFARGTPRRPVPAHHASGWQTVGGSEPAWARFAGRQPRPVSHGEPRASEIRLDRHWYLHRGLIGKE